MSGCSDFITFLPVQYNLKRMWTNEESGQSVKTPQQKQQPRTDIGHLTFGDIAMCLSSTLFPDMAGCGLEH